MWQQLWGRRQGTTERVSLVPFQTTVRIRRVIFLYDCLALLILFALAWGYFPPHQRLQNLIPPPLRGIPIYAAWFGSLGGVMISLKGVYDHGPGDWQDRYNLWHIGRPVSAGVAGGMTYLLLSIVSATQPTQPAVLAAAFILGTQDRRFFNFLGAVARLVVQVPGEDQQVAMDVTEVHPSQGTPGKKITILGQGFDSGAAVFVGGVRLADVAVSRDGATITGTLPAGTGSADILVANPDGAARLVTAKFIYA